MKESITNGLLTPQYCMCCHTSLNGDETICKACNYPINGSDKEKQSFIQNRDLKNNHLKRLHMKVKNAIYTLFITAGLFFLQGLISFGVNYNNDDGSMLLIEYSVMSVLFLLLGIYSQKKPVITFISGIALIALHIISSIIISPTNLFSGILIKGTIITFLIIGINAFYESEKLKKTFS